MGLPESASAACDPPHVARLFDGLVTGKEVVRLRDGVVKGSENGRIVLDASGDRGGSRSVKGGRTGDGGAYISEICERDVGEVSAESRWRTLSHWVWVVWSDDWRARRSAEDGA